MWAMLFVTIDDHAGIAFTTMHPGEKKHEASAAAQCDGVLR
jgi:hypothetical protein